jgi:hypothetical protein
MKSKHAIIGILAQLIVTGAALAVTVDVSDIEDAEDIKVPGACTLSDVTCTYDDFGKGVDDATVDASGISGTTGGVLLLTLNAPVTHLSFDFSLLGASSSVADTLSVIFKNAGKDMGDTKVDGTFVPNDPAQPGLGGRIIGSLAYDGAAFDQAFIYFSTDAQTFNATNISYGPPAAVVVGDLNGDGHVDMSDVLLLVTGFGTTLDDVGVYNSACDINGDGAVDVADLLTLVYHFGT